MSEEPKPGTQDEAHIGNSRAWKLEAGGSRVQGRTQLSNVFEVSHCYMTSYLGGKREKKKEKKRKVNERKKDGKGEEREGKREGQSREG